MFEINGVIWRIFIVPSNHPELKQPNGEFALGCCNNTTHSIYISAAIEQSPLYNEVLYHEITHAVIESYNITFSYSEEELLASFISVYGSTIHNIANSFLK